MVSNKLRTIAEPLLSRAGKALGRVGISPNALTFTGFALATLAGFLFALRPSQPYLAAIAIIVSGLFDVLDGAVARATGKMSMLGSFSDSVLDRVSEIAFFTGIAYGGYGLQGWIILLTVGLSLLVSYSRAKAESLGLSISGIGVGERAERLLVLVIFSLVGLVWVGVYVILALAAVTFGQRAIFVSREITRQQRLLQREKVGGDGPST